MKKIFIISIVSVILVFGVYLNLNLEKGEYFKYATQKIENYNPKRKDLVVIIDYRKNIFRERIFVLDMKNKEIILSSRVSHAWNSGVLYPTKISNEKGTNKTSIGSFITRGTKYGGFGYSMIVDGLDKGINNNAKSRAIIFHSTKKMFTPWSKGCFATNEEVNKKLIDLTKNGVLVCVIG